MSLSEYTHSNLQQQTHCQNHNGIVILIMLSQNCIIVMTVYVMSCVTCVFTVKSQSRSSSHSNTLTVLQHLPHIIYNGEKGACAPHIIPGSALIYCCFPLMYTPKALAQADHELSLSLKSPRNVSVIFSLWNTPCGKTRDLIRVLLANLAQSPIHAICNVYVLHNTGYIQSIRVLFVALRKFLVSD